MSYMNLWRDKAIHREGKRLKVYKDTRGFLTVGIGHKVLPHDGLKLGDFITEAQCEAFFRQDTQNAEQAALKQAQESKVFTDEWIAALISVNFQLGVHWTGIFKETWPAICAGNYDRAIMNLRRSMWYKQTPARVEDFIEAINELRKPKIFTQPKKRSAFERIALFFKKEQKCKT